MNTNILEQVKKLELEILKDVDDICVKNGLKYYLVGGTLLGAIRHKGFIPWDDDIDVGMFREDYNKFIEILSKNHDDKYFVQNFNTEPNYLRYITKIRLNGTQFIEGDVEGLKINHGIFIDVFPLDKIDLTREEKIENRVRFANMVMRLKRIKAGKTKGKTRIRTLRNQLVKALLKLAPDKLINSTIDFIYGYENKKRLKYVTNFGSQYGWRKQTFPIDVYGEGTYLEFEGHQFMAPAKWEVILKSLYGDYMKLPPEEKRNSGHDVVHIDLGKYAEN